MWSHAFSSQALEGDWLLSVLCSSVDSFIHRPTAECVVSRWGQIGGWPWSVTRKGALLALALLFSLCSLAAEVTALPHPRPFCYQLQTEPSKTLSK